MLFPLEPVEFVERMMPRALVRRLVVVVDKTLILAFAFADNPAFWHVSVQCLDIDGNWLVSTFVSVITQNNVALVPDQKGERGDLLVYSDGA